VAATFVVMAFILAKEEVGSYADLFEGASWRTWLRHFRRDAAAQRFDSWSSPGCSQSQQSWISLTVGVER
jgi:hypothetical protein